MRKLSEIEQPYLKEDPFDIEVGDTVNVKVRITETVEKRGKLESKERIQVFSGVVIAKKGAGVTETFTVRRIVAGEGVERVFPIHSPSVSAVEIVRRARVRRAKLYYLRERSGKSARLRERIVPRAKTAKKKK
jgi:large subunit ribosomal protein L19